MIGLDSDTIPFRFQYALFIVVEKLAASGYGKYVPKADGHMILSCFLMMIGRILECYIIGESLKLENYISSSELEYEILFQ